MIIIGESINATREPVAEALSERDEETIIETAVRQAEAGADLIDVNGGDPHKGREAQNMEWLVELVHEHTDCPVSVDSADPEAVGVGLKLAERADRGRPLLNSVSLESHRRESLLPLVENHDCGVIALLMNDDGPPSSTDDRVERAEEIVELLAGCGKELDEIVIDPCFLPIATDPTSGRAAIDAIAEIRQRWPEVHIGGGCSNLSFGLPQRRNVNTVLLAQAIYNGMDAGIIDPCAPGIQEAILAAEAVAGADEFCVGYVNGMRALEEDAEMVAG
jgi:5-methyltetrahydrofolate--homocysteine methyltransferase